MVRSIVSHAVKEKRWANLKPQCFIVEMRSAALNTCGATALGRNGQGSRRAGISKRERRNYSWSITSSIATLPPLSTLTTRWTFLNPGRVTSIT